MSTPVHYSACDLVQLKSGKCQKLDLFKMIRCTILTFAQLNHLFRVMDFVRLDYFTTLPSNNSENIMTGAKNEKNLTKNALFSPIFLSSPLFLLPYVLLVCLLDNVLPWVCLKGPSTPLDREFAPLLPRCKGPWQGLYTLYRASLQKEMNNKT